MNPAPGIRAVHLLRYVPSTLRTPLVAAVNRLRLFLNQRAAVAPSDTDRLTSLPARTGHRYRGQRVAVAGLFGTRCGLQRAAVLTVLDLRARGVAVLAFDLTSICGMTPSLATDATADLSSLSAWQPGDILVHLNPPLFASAMLALPADLLARACVVGCWVWELPVISLPWRQCAAAADEIWVPSPFVADALRRGLPDFAGPITVVPYAVERDPMQAISQPDRAALRARFGFAQDGFIAGLSFSFDSNYARKNPCGAIDAFRLAFQADEAAQLVIRCNDTVRHRRLFDHLRSYAGDDARIVVWDNADIACPITAFYGLLDLYVSLHRSEGYGLNLAEALQAGVAVLATGWGLAPELSKHGRLHQVASRLVVPLDPQGVYECYEGALWAEPDIVQAAAALREDYHARA